ncbi:MAG TPA: hypothetical protein VJH89_03625 [Patescibacteria group bacterium]|nr:hypothetical protein [Patescibacteria group bacterium]
MSFITILIFGILASCFALIIELIVTGLTPVSLIVLETFSFNTVLIVLALALIEEITKYVFLHQYALRYLKKVFLTLQQILFYSLSFGIGFSLLEGVLSWQNGIPLTLFSLVSRALLHSSTSFLFAYFLFRPITHLSWVSVIRFIGIASLIHFTYNILTIMVF